MRGSTDHTLSLLAGVVAFAALVTGALATTGNSIGDNSLRTPHRALSVVAALGAAVVAVKIPETRMLVVFSLGPAVASGGMMEARAFAGFGGVAHAVAASAMLSATAIGVLLTTPVADMNPVIDSGSPSLRSLARVTWIALLVQTGLGALYRHNIVGLMPHIGCALVVMGMVMYAGIAAWSTENAPKALTRTALALLVLTGVQMLLGIAAYLYRGEPSAASGVLLWSVIHVAVGAITTATCALMEIQISRYVRLAVVA
jgi:heme A synthase